MKVVTIAAAMALAGLSPAWAAVSGYHDSAAQIAAVLGAEGLADTLKQQPIDSIDFDGARQDGGLVWEVDTRDCDVDVVLTPVAPQGTGKTTYTVASISACR